MSASGVKQEGVFSTKLPPCCTFVEKARQLLVINNRKINMNVIKLSFGSLAVLLGSLLFVSVASAATITNAEWDGNLEVYGKPSAKKEVALRVSVPAGEVVENIGLTVGGSGLVEDCFAVGGSTGLQEGTHFVNRDVKLPPFTGWFDLDWRTNGIFGAIQAVDCDDTNGDMDSGSFGSVIRVITNVPSSNDDLGSEESSLIASLQAMIKDLMAQIKALQNPPAPVRPAFCTNIVLYNGSNAWMAQASLLANGFAAPFNAIGVYQPPGNWLSASIAAAAQAAAACK